MASVDVPGLNAGMHPNVERVASAASRLGLTIEVRTFPEGTKTAADAATAIGVEVGQIVKSLVFGIEHADATTEIVMALMSGANQLDERKLATAAGGVRCTRVDADAVRAATGYPIGGVPPFGHATALRMFADVDLLAFDEVWAAAGTWHDVFGIEPAALISAVSPTITALAK